MRLYKYLIMKHLLTLILLSTLFISCSKDDEIVYLDPYILNGNWKHSVIVENGSVLNFVYFFRNGRVVYYSYPSEGGEETTLVDTTFKLTETEIIFAEKTYLGKRVKYRIVGDTLISNEKTKYKRQ